MTADVTVWMSGFQRSTLQLFVVYHHSVVPRTASQRAALAASTSAQTAGGSAGAGAGGGGGGGAGGDAGGVPRENGEAPARMLPPQAQQQGQGQGGQGGGQGGIGGLVSGAPLSGLLSRRRSSAGGHSVAEEGGGKNFEPTRLRCLPYKLPLTGLLLPYRYGLTGPLLYCPGHCRCPFGQCQASCSLFGMVLTHCFVWHCTYYIVFLLLFVLSFRGPGYHQWSSFG